MLPRLASVGPFAMLLTMLREVIGSAVVIAVLVASCGGSTNADHEIDGGEEMGGNAGHPSTGGRSGGTGGDRFDANTPDVPDVEVVDVNSDYVAPTCPDAAPSPIQEECDAFGDSSDCPPGLACFPFVEYPNPTEECAQEHFGTRCFTPGAGVQGQPCGGGDCAAGHMCVLTGEGTICVRLCSTRGGDNCPPGLLCEPIDVQPGIGGCY